MVQKDQLFMGLAAAALCALGLWKSDWFLRNTRKGQRLVESCGDTYAIWIWRLLMTCGLVLGLLFARGILNPLRW